MAGSGSQPDPDILDPARSGSQPDPQFLDPAGSGSGRIRIRTGSTKFTGYPAGSGSGSGAPLLARHYVITARDQHMVVLNLAYH